MPTAVIAFLLPTAAKKRRKPVRTASSFNKNTQVGLELSAPERTDKKQLRVI